MSPRTWSDDRISQLKKLWVAGLSCSQIAAEMGFITRNSVIGKVHRLGLEGRAKNAPFKSSAEHQLERIRLKNERRRIRRAVDKPWVIPRGARPIICLEIDPRNIPLEELQDGECRWPDGEGPYLFCGTPTFEDSSYCCGHFHASIGNGTASERYAEKVSEKQIGAFA